MSETENNQADASSLEVSPPDASPSQPNLLPKPKPAPKKAKSEKSEKSKQKSDPSQPRVKRGPARPHRRLAVDVIDSRIAKLQKRLDRAKAQIDDAGRHVEGYLRERDFRAKEAQ